MTTPTPAPLIAHDVATLLRCICCRSAHVLRLSGEDATARQRDRHQEYEDDDGDDYIADFAKDESNAVVIDAASAAAIADAIAHNEVVTALAISATKLGDAGAATIATALRATKRTLHSLELVHCDLHSDSAEAVSAMLQVNTTMRVLSLADNQLGEQGAIVLATALRSNSTLQSLELGSCAVGDEGTKALCEALEVNQSLRTLGLQGNEIGGDGMTALAVVLSSSSTKLKTLDLSHNAILCAHMTPWIDALKINRTLESLDLSHNGLQEEGFLALANALCVNATLRELDLSGNASRLSIGGGELAAALRVNSTLQKLKCKGNLVGTCGYSELSDALLENKSLQCLDVQWALDLDTGHPDYLRDPSAVKLAAALQTNTTLRELHVRTERVSCAALCRLFEAIQSNPNSALEAFQLLHMTYTEDVIVEQALGNLLETNTTLRALHFHYGGKATPIVSTLASNRTLQVLDLRSTWLPEDVGASLADLVATNGTLRVLNLAYCGIGDANVVQLASALSSNHKLEELELGYSGISEDGAEALAMALRSTTTLRVLGLSLNKIRDRGGVALAHAISAGTSLKQLEMARNHLELAAMAVMNETDAVLSISREIALLSVFLRRTDIADPGKYIAQRIFQYAGTRFRGYVGFRHVAEEVRDGIFDGDY